MTTIRDVADEAGVSVATVSRLINNSGYVGEQSRQKILTAIKKLNYIPNEIARSLNKQSMKILGLLVPDITNPYFPSLIKGVEQCAMQHGYMLLLGNTEGQEAIGENYLHFFKQYKVAGLIKIDGTHLNTPENVPTVSLDRMNDHDRFAVVSDDFYGGKLIGQAIKETNHGSILIVTGPLDIKVSQLRLQGMQSVFDQHKITYQIYSTPSFQMEFADQVALEIIHNYPNIDTVIAPNDIYALALIQAWSQFGYVIPKNVQIIGYDGIVFGAYAHPGLTTIEQPAYQIGYQGTELLLAIINQQIDQQSSKIIQIKPQLLQRNSLREVE
ncbi:LacI family DNA-binding transcriptional regulator [Facklamia miroungae]|uniref:LacI family transcriptional regulator n=1 Tax=Facklamia miroungae TaxID=120956 RepID=A0A1G7QBZ7_9LACT|nr:LacI family DNA-binding transcriptional regulator [Facklamia miroungae]NKZ28895.1 LacI family transcriptional regulator [Facklamia miroungae]SDF96081.1 LacI family transcriptional regulator [Facklamia miroungae]